MQKQLTLLQIFWLRSILNNINVLIMNKFVLYFNFLKKTYRRKNTMQEIKIKNRKKNVENIKY